jgi:hypothetical protein
MADLKISQLTGATTPLAGTEVLPIVQSSTTKKVATNDLTVKNVRSNATTGILQIAGPATAATRTMTVPDANFTVARTDAAQTFTGSQTFAGAIFQSSTGPRTTFYCSATAVSVSTTPVSITGPFPAGYGAFALVFGERGFESFLDILIVGDDLNPVVLHSTNTLGSPAARTYTRSATETLLAMAADTFNVKVQLFRT